MPWKETCAMDERIGFVSACLAGEEPVTAVCARFGISRKTGYKWLARYRAAGPAGLVERSRRPRRLARAIAPEMALSIVDLRLASLDTSAGEYEPGRNIFSFERRVAVTPRAETCLRLLSYRCQSLQLWDKWT